MGFRLALEDIEPNHWVAYALDLPGCFSSATNPETALAQAKEIISQHLFWLSSHDPVFSAFTTVVEVEIVEQFHSYESTLEPGYLVNAFFEDDRKPLSFWEVGTALRLMSWSRVDLLDLVHSPKDYQLSQQISGEKFYSVMGVLQHIANAENWYFDRLGLGIDHESLPEEIFERLRAVRKNAKDQLVRLVGDSRVESESCEAWSARKVVRRMLWHERDHTFHIRKMLMSRQVAEGE
jgi:predicted RNase H-like HicB family nuclease